MNRNVFLKDVLEIQNGFAFDSVLFNDNGNGTPIIRIRDLARGFSETYYSGDYDKRFVVKRNDLLIGMDGEFRCYLWQGEDALLNQRVCRLQNFSNEVNSKYIYYLINKYLVEIENNTAFVTVKHISSKQISAIQIHLPPLSKQERIVRLLDEAETLRATREDANARMEQFVPALFYEMFGDPNENKNSWQTFKLKDLIVEGDKVNYGVVQPGDDFPGGIPVVRVGDFDNMQISLDNIKRIDPAIEENYKRSRLCGDEILIACVGSIGLIALADVRLKSFNIVRAVARVRPSDKLDRLFLASYFTTSFVQDYFKNSTRTVAQPTLNIKQIEETVVPVPPLALQREFAARVEAARGVQSAQGKSTERIEALYQSMLSRAFAGEL